MALEYDQVEVDYCAACGGVWLDQEEVALLFGDESEVAALFHALAPGNTEVDRKLRCPISGRFMRKGRADGNPPVTFDYSEHGFWFDRGELSRMLRAEELAPGTERVVAWLREVFPRQAAPEEGETA